jgi:hypothetical protein
VRPNVTARGRGRVVLHDLRFNPFARGRNLNDHDADSAAAGLTGDADARAVVGIARSICGRSVLQIDSARDFATLQTWAQTKQRTARAPAERAVTTGLLEPHLSQGGIVIRSMRRSGPV